LNQGFKALTFVLAQKAGITSEEREHIDKVKAGGEGRRERKA